MALSSGALALGLALPGGWFAHWAAGRLVPGPAAGPGVWAVMALAVLMAGSAAALAGSSPDALDVALGWALGWPLLVLAVADLRAMRLPDVLTLPLVAAGLIAAAAGQAGASGPAHFAPDVLADHAIGAAAGYAAFAGLARAFRHVRGVEGLGLGDAKLAAAAGAWLGWRPLPLTVLLGCGLAFGVVFARLLLRGRETLREPLAFGAPLAAAIWICWLVR
jgi:leader peptidase (prepilin peptidase)/N-methyltransferase